MRRVITALAVSADFAWAISGSADMTLRLWDQESGICLATYYAGASVCSLAASFSRGQVVCGCTDGQVHILTIRRGFDSVRLERSLTGSVVS